jgi:hypothetical protein
MGDPAAEMGIFGETVHHGEYDRLVVHAWKPFDKIHGHMGPDSARHFQRLQQPYRMQDLIPLASHAGSDVFFVSGARLGHKEASTQAVERFLNPFMPHAMHRRQDAGQTW